MNGCGIMLKYGLRRRAQSGIVCSALPQLRSETMMHAIRRLRSFAEVEGPDRCVGRSLAPDFDRETGQERGRYSLVNGSKERLGVRLNHAKKSRRKHRYDEREVVSFSSGDRRAGTNHGKERTATGQPWSSLVLLTSSCIWTL